MSAPPTTPSAATSPPVPQGRRMVAVVVLVPVLVALALWASAWPSARLAPRDLPVGVAGPAAAAGETQRQLEAREGAFEVHRYPDEAAARSAVEERTVYGAVVVTEHGPELLTASAASPLVAQLLQQAMAERAPKGSAVPVTDVVPTDADDPRGAVLGAAVLPLALAGVAAGAVVTLLGLRGFRAVASLVGAAVLVGLVATALVHSWLGALSGDWWAEAGAFGLAALAVGAAVAGLAALAGPPGIGLGGLLVVLLGNPFAGAASAPELLPEPVGVMGQWLPPGAAVSLLRSVSFFDGAAATTPALTLTWWAALGLGAVLLRASLTRRRTATRPATEREPVPAG
ncbi:ABC transporter permease [Streptomyces sp. NPDC086783]|uniref:ABC transporter permease n=1 Tax=Streptomyces sp. NPDC086783 TaxID=3365758 RepID=UPI003824A085